MYSVDHYVITAPDIALAGWLGRAYNAERRTWESVHNASMLASRLPTLRQHLLGVFLTCHHATGQLVAGVRVLGCIQPDPQATEQVIQIFDRHQSPARNCYWFGRVPLCAGFFWRIHAGGLVATDYVDCRITYE